MKKTGEHGIRRNANWLILDKLNDWVVDYHLSWDWTIPTGTAKAQNFYQRLTTKYTRMLPTVNYEYWDDNWFSCD